MLKKIGNKWVSETDEGTLELTPEEAYFEIPIQMLELLKQASAGDEQTDIDNAQKARTLYDASSSLNPRWVFFGDMTRKCVMPLLDAISKDNQAPRTCEIISMYAVREMWGRICNHQDTDMLWELFSFYRDRVFPLTLRKNLVEGEQYARIAYAFYCATRLNGSSVGLPIIQMLNDSHKNNVRYETEIDYYNVGTKNITFNMDSTVSDVRNAIYYDLVYIPKLISDKAVELNKTLYISETQKQEYLLVQKGFSIVQKIATTKYDLVEDAIYDKSITQFYNESIEHEWYGCCFILSSLSGKNSEREKIAAKVGDYHVDRIVQHSAVISDVLANVISIVVLIASIIGVGYLEKSGHVYNSVLVAMGLIVLQSRISQFATNVFKNNFIYNFVWMFSIMVPLWFLLRRAHFLIAFIAIIMFFMSYAYGASRRKKTTAYIIACSMRVLLPCTLIYFNHVITAILVMVLSFATISFKDRG